VGIAQKEAPFAAYSYIPDLSEPNNRVEVVANPKLNVLWLKTKGTLDSSILFAPEFEKNVKKQIKEIVNVTFN